MKRPGDSKDRLRLWIKLLRTTHTIESALRERLRASFETTLPRFDVMAALARADRGLTMTALSRQLLVSNGNVTGIVERLVADRLVFRTDEIGDKRSIRVCLTPKGRTEFAAIANEHENWVADLLGKLDASDVSSMLGLLAKLAPENAPSHAKQLETQ
jgi:DNA-binding MarR family transcriptional regulator